jgi:hypothetical protein
MGRLKGAKPTAESIAAALTVPERVLLFCLASDTDRQKAGVTHATAQHMMVRGLIERDQAVSRFVPTKQGRAVLAAFLARRAMRRRAAFRQNRKTFARSKDYRF